MTRGRAILAIAVIEGSLVIAAGIIAVTGVLVTGRAIEWLLIYRGDR